MNQMLNRSGYKTYSRENGRIDGFTQSLGIEWCSDAESREPTFDSLHCLP